MVGRCNANLAYYTEPTPSSLVKRGTNESDKKLLLTRLLERMKSCFIDKSETAYQCMRQEEPPRPAEVRQKRMDIQRPGPQNNLRLMDMPGEKPTLPLGSLSTRGIKTLMLEPPLRSLTT